MAFKWSDEAGRHVTCSVEHSENSPAVKRGRKSQHQITEFLVFFPKHDQKPMGVWALWNKARGLTDIPRNSFRDLCDRETSAGTLEKIVDANIGPQYRLTRRPGE